MIETSAICPLKQNVLLLFKFFVAASNSRRLTYEPFSFLFFSGVLEHIIPPHERQFVCTTDYENPTLMVPINKSATKLVNLTDKSCKDIPVYKKDQNERATQVRMMKKEEVLSGKYLFVVKYLQWRRDFSYPLGIVVRTLSRGEDLKSSMEIAYAEHGIRRVFKKET